jgi:hypothetical protein
MRYLKSIEMYTIPDMKTKSCKPYVEIINVRDGSVQFNAKKGFKLKSYNRNHTSGRLNSAVSLQGASYKYQSSDDKSERSFTQADSEFKFPSERDDTVGRNTQLVVRASSARKHKILGDEDRPSLFAFDNDNTDVNENPKRRSNSMGKEGKLLG